VNILNADFRLQGNLISPAERRWSKKGGERFNTQISLAKDSKKEIKIKRSKIDERSYRYSEGCSA